MVKKLKKIHSMSTTRRMLITGGCSFTVHEPVIPYLEDKKIVAWPRIVAYELDMELVNLAVQGASNAFIENALTDAILKYKNQNPVVMVLWSQPHRVNINDCFTDGNFKLNNYKHVNHMPVSVDDWPYTIAKSSLRSIWRTQNLAKQFGLDYMHHLGCWRLKESRISTLPKNTIYNQLQNDWYYKNLDFSMNEIEWGIVDWYKPVPGDGHPDQWSHHKLAEMFIDKYERQTSKMEFIYE